MAHHLLDKLDIVRAFAEPRAECVSHVMYAKMRQQFRLTIFQFSLIHFFGVVGDGDTLDGPIDIMGTEKVLFRQLQHTTLCAVTQVNDGMEQVLS